MAAILREFQKRDFQIGFVVAVLAFVVQHFLRKGVERSL